VQERIDWGALARELGLIRETDNGRTERGGSDEARAALERIIGPGALRSSVDDYVAGAPGGELARSVLWLLHPPAAMERCLEIYREAPDVEDRRAAVELLRVVADRRALAWVPDFLADLDEGIQNWGIGVVDQLVFAGLADISDCESVLALAEDHTSSYVREMAGSVRERLRVDVG
jgi:hypothetical protein